MLKYLTQEVADKLADFFEEKGFDSIYSTVYEDNKPRMYDRVDYQGKIHRDYMPAYMSVDLSEFGNLPEHWQIDVANVMSARRSAAYKNKIKSEIEAFDTTPGIRAYMLAHYEERPRSPTKHDLRFFAKAATTTTNQFGKARPAFQVDSNASCKLKLSEAVLVSYSQEAYADMSRYAVPFTGEIVDKKKSLARLCEFVRYADTHTGWAGSGCNYSVEEINEEGKFVIISCRASIAD
jgi:hypothetical protein